MAEHKGVLVFAEAKDGKLSARAAELLGGSRKLADELGQELSATLIGVEGDSLARQTIASGADRVYLVDSPQPQEYPLDYCVAVMEQVTKEAMPRIILLGHTSLGRDLAPRLAFRLGTAAITDCIAVAIEPESKRFLMTKSVYGGNAQATYTSDYDPKIATVRAKAMSPLEPDSSRKGEIIRIKTTVDPATIRTRVVEQVKKEPEGVKLEEAPVVIAGGRGIGGAEGFAQIAELAKLLQGAMGATRAPCDNGWVPNTIQIGLSGKTVTPDLYLAIAISGSSQHLSGCSGAKVIVAINKDAEANVFKAAHYGVVGDWKRVLPAFTQKVKELLAE